MSEATIPAGRAAAAALALLAVLAGPGTAPAQEAEEGAASPDQVEAMQEVAWLVGEWRGEGTMRRGPGEPSPFTQTERVSRALGGRLLLVEGKGRARTGDGEEGRVVHHAFGVLSWDREAGHYRFHAYRADGGVVDAEAHLEDGVLVWGFEIERGRLRDRIRRTEEDRWHEVGEYSPDGSTWHPFLEMTLRRAP